MVKSRAKKHRGRSDRTPRKLKKELTKQGLVEMWLDFDDETMKRLEVIAILRGEPEPSSKKTLGKIAAEVLVTFMDKQQNG